MGTRLHLAICGGGTAAALLLQALRKWPPPGIDVTVFEPRARLGAGLAYSTNLPAHLLNTRAVTMSLNEDPEDFVNWLRAKRPNKIINWSGNDFAARMHFADYTQDRLSDIKAEPHLRLNWIQASVDSLVPRGERWEIVPASGSPIEADVVVLATGNEPPRPLSHALPPSLHDWIIDDPWNGNAKAQIISSERVLLLGTGLTAVDVTLELLDRRHTGPIYCVSRRGLLPRSHGAAAPVSEGPLSGMPTTVREAIRFVRRLIVDDARGETWRRVFIELRSLAPVIWRSWPTTERRRFLRHVRPFWEAHRHRIPQSAHRRIERARTRDQLMILRGRVTDIALASTRDFLRVQIEHGGLPLTLDVDRLINCTGPETDVRQSTNPLLRSLLTDDLARADALGLGLAVDARSRVKAANGSAHRNLYAVGALTKGLHWEIGALAELREQVNALARRLLHEFNVPTRARERRVMTT